MFLINSLLILYVYYMATNKSNELTDMMEDVYKEIQILEKKIEDLEDTNRKWFRYFETNFILSEQIEKLEKLKKD